MTMIAEESVIITGLVDAFCLACDIHLQNDTDIDMHIENPKHNENVKSNPSAIQSEGHMIRKFKYGYFCSNCNVLLRTLTTVNFHVQNIKNTKTTNDKKIKRIDTFVIAFDNILISEEAWHGIVGDTCVLCDIEFEDANNHKKEPVHLLQLIQHKIFFGTDRTIYRQLQDNCCQCLTCNMLVASSKIQEHFIDTAHEKSYKKFIKTNSETNNDVEDNEVKSNTHSDNNNKDNNQNDAAACTNMREIDLNHNKITVEKKKEATNRNNLTNLNSVSDKNSEVARNNTEDLVINVTNQEEDKCASGTVCNSEEKGNIFDKEMIKDQVTDTDSKIVKKANKEIKASSDNEKALVTSIVPSTSTSDINENEETFAKSNSLTYNRVNHTAYCRICVSRLPSTLRSMKEHVNGTTHKKNIARNKSETKLIKNQHKKKGTQSFFDFLDSLHIEANTQKDVIVNAKFCITKLSFYLVSRHGFRYRCQVCEMNLTMHEVDIHMEMRSHQLAMKSIPVLLSFQSEFIREVRPGLFHCGYCNLIEGSRENLDDHLKCTTHLQRRSVGESRISGFLHNMFMQSVFKRMAFMSFFSRVFGNRYYSDDSDDSF